MPNTKLPQLSTNVFVKRQNGVTNQQVFHGVGQDKGGTPSARIATAQPAPTANGLRSQSLHTSSSRTQKNPTPKRKTVHLTLWTNPVVKAELQRIAAQEGISVSAAGSAYLERALQQNADMQYSALLQPIIEQAIRKQMRGISTRLAWLLVRVAFDTGQVRSIATNILGRQPGVTPDMLKTILENSGKSAKGNITRKTPQLSELVAAVEQWLVTDDEGEKNT